MRLYSFFFSSFFFIQKKYFGVYREEIVVVRVLGAWVGIWYLVLACLLVVYGRAEWIRKVMWCEKL